MPTVPTNNLGIQAKWLTKNRSYTSPVSKTKTKLMLHSTATPGAPAENFFPGWNTTSASCSVEFILDNEKILEFLPIGKNGKGCIKSWHCGADANNTHVATEVCEPTEAQLIRINYKAQSQGGKYNRSYTIKRLQMELKRLGYFNSSVDGNFGPLTEKAVKAFQKAKGLTVDGIAGTATFDAMQTEGSYMKYDVEGATPFFNAAYNKAVHLFAFLCNYLGAKPSEIICHSEGFKRGIASNHSDVTHWFPLHGKSMDDFRSDVQKDINGTYVDLGSTSSSSNGNETYLTAVQDLVNVGIIDNSDYWNTLVDATEIDANKVETLMKNAGLYYVTKSHVYGADCLAYVLPLDYPDTWKGTNFSVAGVKSLIKKVAAKAVDDGMDMEYTYQEAVQLCVEVGIINTPDYWMGLETASSVKANYVQAFIRQAAAYFVKMDYQYAVAAVKNPINMNSETRWREKDFTVGTAKALVKAVAASL